MFPSPNTLGIWRRTARTKSEVCSARRSIARKMRPISHPALSTAAAAIEYFEDLVRASPQNSFTKASLLQLTQLLKEDLNGICVAKPASRTAGAYSE